MGERARAATTISSTIAAVAAAYGVAVGPQMVAIASGVVCAACISVVVAAALRRGPFSETAEAAAVGRRLRPRLEKLSLDGRSLFDGPDEHLRDAADYRRAVENWIARIARTFMEANMPTEAARFDVSAIPNNAPEARAMLTRRHEVLSDFIGDLREQEGLPREGDY